MFSIPLPVPLMTVVPPILQPAPVQYTGDTWPHGSIFYDTEASAQAPQVPGVRESTVEDTVSLAYAGPVSGPPGMVSSAGALQDTRSAQLASELEVYPFELLRRGGINLPSSKHDMHVRVQIALIPVVPVMTLKHL